MYTFHETAIPDFITVSSIVSVFEAERNGNETERDGEAHAFWEFLCIKEGQINILVDGELYHLTAGQMIVYEPHSFHSVAASRKAVIDIVCFGTDSKAMSVFQSNIIDLSPPQLEELTHLVTLGRNLFVPAPSDRGMVSKGYVTACQRQRLSNLLELFLLDLYESQTAGNASAGIGASNHANYQSEQFRKLTDYLKAHLDQSLTLEQTSLASHR